MGRLDGKVAIVTGGAQGMGESHARLFVAEGAKVVVTDINPETGQRVADALGADALFVQHDVAKAADWQRVVKAAEDRFGGVNVLVNNAGIIGPVVSLDEFKEADYQTVCGINQTGVFLGMQAVIPGMVGQGAGSIVNISSIAGMVAIYGSPNCAYTASKFAVRGLTKQAAVDYGEHGIRVNSIHPGFTVTPMMDAALDEAGKAGAAALVPIKRLGQPIDVSYLALFLASDESSYITGAEHIIDGGVTAL
ncbi:MAG: glucose 1-dehydrogenase [Gammaproteobacteria bacterium]|nr:glucose 1-dehydrogenase [Gammaproteobacteria bacterium]